MFKIFIVLLIPFKLYAQIGNFLQVNSGELITKELFNERIRTLEALYLQKGYSIELSELQGEEIKSADLNNVIQIINNLNLSYINIPLINKGEELTATKFNTVFNELSKIKWKCSSITECYSNKDSYGNAVYNNVVLGVKNGFLYDSNSSRYLGTQCDDWYVESELAYVDKKLDPTKTNVVYKEYISPNTANMVHYGVPYSVPTCGQVQFWGIKNYGYGYSLLEINSVEVYRMPWVNSAGGNGTTYTQVFTVNKGDILRQGSHYLSRSIVSGGY